MKSHQVCSDPDIYFTDDSIEFTTNFLTQAVKHSGDANTVIIVHWEENEMRLDRQFTHDLDELKKTLSDDDFGAELERRYATFGIKSEPHVSIGALSIDEMTNVSEFYAVYTNGDLKLFVEKDSFRNLGKNAYTINFDGKRFLLE